MATQRKLAPNPAFDALKSPLLVETPLAKADYLSFGGKEEHFETDKTKAESELSELLEIPTFCEGIEMLADDFKCQIFPSSPLSTRSPRCFGIPTPNSFRSKHDGCTTATEWGWKEYRPELKGTRHHVSVITRGYSGTLFENGDELTLLTEGEVFRPGDEIRGTKLEVGIGKPGKTGADRAVRRWNEVVTLQVY